MNGIKPILLKTEFKCKKIQLLKDWSIFNINWAKKMPLMRVHHNPEVLGLPSVCKVCPLLQPSNSSRL